MIIVVGSINMDVCLNVDKIPVPGETVMAEKVSKNCGGKRRRIRESKSGVPNLG